MVMLVVTLNLGLIVFRTGSMSPAIPTGSAALVRTLPAEQVQVGDVVTVPSPVGPLPVTHRVVSVEPLADGSTRLVLRGDANDAPDPFPYDVTEVRRVVAHAPGVGVALVRLHDPRALGTITVLVAGVILWALWPPRRSAPERGPSHAGGPEREPSHAGAPERGPSHAGGPEREPSHAGGPGVDTPSEPEAPRPRRRTAAITGALVLLATGAVLIGPGPSPAAAAPAPEPPTPTVTPTAPPATGYPAGDGVLALSSSLPPGTDWSLSPGDDLLWRVTSAARPPAGADAATGRVWVTLIAGGPLVELGDAVRLTLRLCDGGWAADGACPHGARDLPAPAGDGVVLVDRVPVGELTSERPQQVAVRLQVAEDLPAEAQGQAMYLALRFDAFGESRVDQVGGEVPPQGSEDPGPGAAGPGATGSGAGGPGAGGSAPGPGGLALTGADLRPAGWAVLVLLLGSVLGSWVRDRRKAGR
nr:signal peptidase I [Cellulomonas denverensis]